MSSIPRDLSHLFGTFPGIVQQASSLHWPLHDLLPAALNAQQEVLDQHHVLFLTEVLEVCSCLIQLDDLIPMWVHLSHKHLQFQQIHFKKERKNIYFLEKDCFLKVQEHGENIFSHNVTDCMRNLLYYDHTVATYNAITALQVKQAHNELWNNV